jgi:hypothetical protein
MTTNVAGTVNTGGGGGGGGYSGPTGATGAAGGSGIVILKYIAPAQTIFTFKSTQVWTCPTGVTFCGLPCGCWWGWGWGRLSTGLGGGGGAGGFRTGTGF